MSHPVTILELAAHVLGRQPSSGDDFAEAGLPIMGGCAVCHATVAAYNCCPSHSGYLKCASGCIADDGWDDVEQARIDVFAIEEVE